MIFYCRCVYSTAPIVILDSPFSAVDNNVANNILGRIISSASTLHMKEVNLKLFRESYNQHSDEKEAYCDSYNKQHIPSQTCQGVSGFTCYFKRAKYYLNLLNVKYDVFFLAHHLFGKRKNKEFRDPRGNNGRK